MEDQVEIPIVTTADTSGAKQASAALKEVEKATTASGEASQEAGKKAEFLGLKTGELKKTVRELGREFPIAGMAAKAMMNPLVAGLTLAIGLFAKAKESLAEWNAQMDEAAKKAASPDFEAGIKAKREAMEAAAVSQAEFLAGLSAIGRAEDASLKKIKEATNGWHEYLAAQTEINNAQEAGELSAVNLREKLGTLSPEAAIMARSAIRTRFLRENDALKTRAEQSELAGKQAELARLEQLTPGLLSRETGAARTVEELQARLAQSRADLPAAENRRRDLFEALGKASEERDKIAEKLGGVTVTDDMHGPLAEAFREADKKYTDARSNFERQKKLEDNLRKDIREIPQQLVGPRETLKESQAALSENLNRRSALGKEIADQRSGLAIRQQGRGIVEGLKTGQLSSEAMSDLLSTDEGRQLAAAGLTARTFLRGQTAQAAKNAGFPIPGGDTMIKDAASLSAEAKAQMNALAQIFGGNQKDVIRMLATSIDNAQSMRSEIEVLKRKQAALDSKQKSLGTR